MLSFLSDENLAIHKEHLRTKKLQYSILEKSIEGIKNKNIEEIIRQKLKKRVREDVLRLLSDITLHELFFASFAENTHASSDAVRLSYGSEASFLNALFLECLNLSHGFVCVYYSSGRVSMRGGFDGLSLCLPAPPTLAIDVSEHAYFLDYGFDKERYIMAALPFLDLSKLS